MPMLSLQPKYITDSKGKKKSVVPSIKEYRALIENLEELEDIRNYDQAKKGELEFLTAEKAFEEIEKNH